MEFGDNLSYLAVKSNSLILIAFLVMSSMFLTTLAHAQPPASGDWVVLTTETETYYDQNLYVNGSLYINGNLTLDNVTLIMNEQNTTITVNGSLVLANNAVITATNVGDYNIVFNPGSKAKFADSTIEKYGTEGIWFNRTESVLIDGCRLQGAIYATNTTIQFTDNELTPDNERLDFVTGLYLSGAYNSTISSNLIYSNSTYNNEFDALYSISSRNLTIENNNVTTHDGYGFMVVDINNSTISNNEINIKDTGTGIYIMGEHNIIKSNEIKLTGLAYACILVTGAKHTMIQDNNLSSGPIGSGILIVATDNVTVENANIAAVSPYNNIGIYISNSNNTQVYSSGCDNFYMNMYLQNSILSRIENNTLTNGVYGFFVEDASRNKIENNQISNANSSGFWLKRVAYNDIKNNTVWSNGWGLEAIETDNQHLFSILKNNTWNSSGVHNVKGEAVVQTYVRFEVLNYYGEGVFNALVEISGYEYYTDLEGYTTATTGTNHFTLYTVDNTNAVNSASYPVNVSWPRLPTASNYEYTNATVDFNASDPMKVILYINSGPDLYIESITLSDDEVTEGDTIIVTVAVHNKWAAPVNNVYVLVQGSPFALYGEGNISTIAPNGTESVDISITIKNTYGFGWDDEELEIYIDPDNDIEPYIVNTTNNKDYVALKILESDSGGEFPMWLLPFNVLLLIIIITLLWSAWKEKKVDEEGVSRDEKAPQEEPGDSEDEEPEHSKVAAPPPHEKLEHSEDRKEETTEHEKTAEDEKAETKEKTEELKDSSEEQLKDGKESELPEQENPESDDETNSGTPNLLNIASVLHT